MTVTAASATIFYIYTDQLNTPRAITNEASTTIWKWDNNDPFGANAPDEDPDGDSNKFVFNLRFPGQYADKETGLAYNYYPTTIAITTHQQAGIRRVIRLGCGLV